MNKETIFDIAKYITFMVVLYGCIWVAGNMFAESISDYEVIKPKDGVECIVVSRMFNTSVDCWKEF